MHQSEIVGLMIELAHFAHEYLGLHHLHDVMCACPNQVMPIMHVIGATLLVPVRACTAGNRVGLRRAGSGQIHGQLNI